MADFERDYVMRVIRDMVRFVSTVVLGRTEPVVDIDPVSKAQAADLPPASALYSELLELAEEGNVNDAEDLLYERLDSSDSSYLEAGLAFYQHLTGISDAQLEEWDYSREEILDGVHELCSQFGIDGLDQFR